MIHQMDLRPFNLRCWTEHFSPCQLLPTDMTTPSADGIYRLVDHRNYLEEIWMLYSLGVYALCSEQPFDYLRQLIYANANKLQFTAPYIGMVTILVS